MPNISRRLGRSFNTEYFRALQIRVSSKRLSSQAFKGLLQAIASNLQFADNMPLRCFIMCQIWNVLWGHTHVEDKRILQIGNGRTAAGHLANVCCWRYYICNAWNLYCLYIYIYIFNIKVTYSTAKVRWHCYIICAYFLRIFLLSKT